MKVVTLDQFKPRDYQIPLCKAFDEGKLRRYLIIWGRRCLAGDTHIIMADGSWKYLKDIQVGDKVLSWDGNQFVPDTVVNHWSAGIKQTKQIQSYSCLPLTASSDHAFATSKHSSSKIHWKKLNDIDTTDPVMQYAGLNTSSSDSLLLAEFLGYMLSDGYCNEYQQPKFTNKNPSIIARVQLLAETLFNVRIVLDRYGNCDILRFPAGDDTSVNTVKQFFVDNGINQPKKERRLPKICWSWSQDEILSFFAGIISGDGSIYIPTKPRNLHGLTKVIPISVEVVLNMGHSDLYAWDCYWLLRKIGIVPQVPYKEKESNWKIKISKCLDVKSILSHRIYGKEIAQDRALDIIKDRYRQAKSYKGCFRLLTTITDDQDQELYDLKTKDNHNFVANGYLVHNSGKDICAFNLMLRAALKRVGTYMYILPTYSMCRKIIWDAIDIQGRRIIDYYVPSDILESKNEQQMRLRLKNGSQIQLIGSDDVDRSLVGTNFVGAVFSEFALQDPRAWQLSIPILKASDGWALFVSTPRGKNALYELYLVAKQHPDWFCQLLTLNDTQHISLEEVEKEIQSGQISRDLAEQEFFCSFDLGVAGSLYGKYIDDLRLKGQITHVPYEPYLPVYTAWDLGYNDPTQIIFFQLHNNQIRVIDTYSNNQRGLDHYAKIVKEKEYVYAKHIAPFDIAVHDLSTGVSRWKMMHDLGITFVRYTDKAPSIDDGIETVRKILPRVWFDEKKAAPLIRSLENYRQEYDHKKKVYKTNPLHDDASHFADAFRYAAIYISKYAQTSSTPESIERHYKEAVMGDRANLPPIFQDTHNRMY